MLWRWRCYVSKREAKNDMEVQHFVAQDKMRRHRNCAECLLNIYNQQYQLERHNTPQ